MEDPTEYILGAIMTSGCTDREEAESVLAQHDALQRARAIEAARSEYLHDDTGTPEDEAYNQGISDAVAAIDALGGVTA